MKITPARSALYTATAFSICCSITPLQAASTTNSEQTNRTIEEITVTARMRAESDLTVPVTVSAFSAEDIDNAGIDSFADLTSVVPSLTVSEVSGGLGGAIIMRGIGTSAGSNASFEQTVSVNIDGVQLSRGTALRIAQLDMQQIEVLRGPQALFFGKNSPAGAISITTQDPTDSFTSLVRAGYEFNAEQASVDLMLSGPLTDSLGGRLFINSSEIKGWVDNQATDIEAQANALVPGAVNARMDQGPENDFLFARASLQWEASDSLQVRTKFSHAKQEGPGFQQGSNQRIYCPNGTAQVGFQVARLSADPAVQSALTDLLAVSDCKANDTYAHGSINPQHLLNSDLGKNEKGLGQYKLGLGSVQADWDINPELRLTAVTGFADIEEKRYDTYSYNPASAFAGLTIGGITEWQQISQELRLSSSFDGPLNFLVGGFVESTELNTYIQNIATPGPRFDHTIDGKTLSAFGALFYALSDSVEISGGLRWTDEERDLAIDRNGDAQPLAPDSASFDDISPELTLSWRPNDDLTLFASYREGFKSGGFGTPNINQGAFGSPQDFLFKPETVEGFEFGLHARALQGQLRLNAALYDYQYKELQVNSLDNTSGLPVIRINNAAEASLRGAELDFELNPSNMPGLSVNGALNYSDTHFDEFEASCYIGQTQADGCTLGLDTGTGRYQAQDLSGAQLPNDSEWSGNLGVAYSGNFGESAIGYRISTDLSYRSEYNPHPELAPGARQDGVTYLNGGLQVFSADKRWEVALLGRNLNDEYRAQSSSNAPTTGVGSLTGSNTSGGLADLVGYVNRGREILLRITFRPSAM
ncbi:MAG: TonB-dependent receptor [Gammaproteobacteria bacterium]|uniref:TonB-dependent receptor n=1 Tax=Pseudomaricurvus alcaniphilus TaxID=1166482 RepID=UPI00140A8039|nr:TonB-dependent receptor [Pseudomaricurvus alcaniphilus]MBR9909323.1 TonB-dependent receptor [Gammaproteobacteria bacterium]NHN38259.1 TonB-dependent receptor [Pseudomaricurvus alcaniphilus]